MTFIISIILNRNLKSGTGISALVKIVTRTEPNFGQSLDPTQQL